MLLSCSSSFVARFAFVSIFCRSPTQNASRSSAQINHSHIYDIFLGYVSCIQPSRLKLGRGREDIRRLLQTLCRASCLYMIFLIALVRTSSMYDLFCELVPLRRRTGAYVQHVGGDHCYGIILLKRASLSRKNESSVRRAHLSSASSSFSANRFVGASPRTSSPVQPCIWQSSCRSGRRPGANERMRTSR